MTSATELPKAPPAASVELLERVFSVDNGAGWRLHARRITAPTAGPPKRAVALLPGYGMNGFILGYHPSGASMERTLAVAGFEVWTIHLRRQGPSCATSASAERPSMRAYATRDLPRLLDAIAAHTTSSSATVDLIGCSLGGTVAYAHLALCPDHRIGSLITLGAPLRWSEVHPAMRVAFASRRLAGAIPFAGTQEIARRVFPILARRVPWALSIYMNTDHIDPAIALDITKTVDDPHPQLNHDIASWMHTKDLILDGVNVTERLRRIDRPLLVVLSNRDGIVPDASARIAYDVWGGADKDVWMIGTDDDWFAHADLYLAPDAPSRVFDPIARWLTERAEG